MGSQETIELYGAGSQSTNEQRGGQGFSSVSTPEIIGSFDDVRPEAIQEARANLEKAFISMNAIIDNNAA